MLKNLFIEEERGSFLLFSSPLSFNINSYMYHRTMYM